MSTKQIITWSLMATMAFAMACGKSSTTTGSSIGISGTLASGSADVDFLSDASYVTDYSVYSIRCVTLSGDLQTASGTCGSDGSFSVSLSGASGNPFGCFVIKGGNIVATMQFESTATSMSGGSATDSSAYTPGSGTSSLALGTITLDESTGKAVVKVANITGDSGSVAGSWVDPTGTWAVSNCTQIDNTGTSGACSQNQGPPSSIYLHGLQATDNTGATHYGLAVWQAQTNFAACGSAEGVTLPAGWTAVTTGMTNALTFDAFPAASAVQAQSFGGSYTCGLSLSGGTTCDKLTGSPNWGSNFNLSDCIAMCQANAAWLNSNSGCPREYTVNWGATQGVAAPGQVTCNSSGCTANGQPFVTVNGNRTKARFLVNEIVVKGKVGTLLDSNTRTESVCIPNASNNGCTNYQCRVTENDRLTVTEDSATSAHIDVVIETVLDPASPSQCSTPNGNNGIANDLGRHEFIFVATKQ